MKVVLLLVCLVFIQIFSASAHQHNDQLKRDASVATGTGRQVREAEQKGENKLKGKKKSKKANGRKNSSKPKRKKKSKKANARKNNSKLKGKKKSKKANGRRNKSKLKGKKKSKKANGRKNNSKLEGKKKSKKANGRRNNSKLKGKKNSKKVNERKNSSKPKRKKNSKKANGRKDKSKLKGTKKSKKANGRENNSKMKGIKKSKKANGRKNNSKLKGKKKPKNANGKNNSKLKEKKKSKKANGRKNNSKLKGKKNSKKAEGRNISKKRTKEEKSSDTSRADDAGCLETLCKKSRQFNKYQNQWRKANRTRNWVNKMNKKKEKAMTTFKNASSFIASATLNGTQCAGGPIPEEAKLVYEALQNCSATATALCTTSTIPGLDLPLITSCEPTLRTYTNGYKSCQTVANCACSCFTALPEEDSTCKFDVVERNTKAAQKKCIQATKIGSFGYCRQQERNVVYWVDKCRICPTSMTTKAPSLVSRRLRQFQRLAGRMKN